GCRSHQGLSVARSGTNHHHQLVWLQSPSQACRSRQASRHDRGQSDPGRFLELARQTFMNDGERDRREIEARLRISEERLRQAEAAGGIGMFELDLISDLWEWTPQVAVLFGLDSRSAGTSFADWERAIFVDDVPKVRAAIETAERTGV